MIEKQDYVTQTGDTMRSIAERFYGNPEAWVRILAANREAFLKWELKEIKRSEGHHPIGAGLTLKIPLR